MESALSKGGVAMNRKTIKISEKRQITIPQKYYEKLGFTNEAEELLAAFKAEQKKVRPAVEAMLADAENAAKGSSEYSTYDDVFGVRE